MSSRRLRNVVAYFARGEAIWFVKYYYVACTVCEVLPKAQGATADGRALHLV